MALDLILLIVLLIAALWTVMTTRLIRAVVGLALTSAILSIIIFRLNSPLAAVFELSVCAGLIPVIFITTISFTERVNKERFASLRIERFGKYWLLPVIIVICAIALSLVKFRINFNVPRAIIDTDARNIIWYLRHMDLLGQVLILLAGAFAVVVLFKEPLKK
ncbi:MAG: hypothetical protein ABSE81_04245 [Candidatus Omnitrophota bacterium]|jgi:NADH-quinone oxidoreductase subunit J